jgi:hypothetical protein
MSLAGSFAGTGLRAVTAVAAAARARVMFFSRPGMRAFLAAGARPGSATGGEAAFGGGQGLLRVADGGVRVVAGGVADQLGVRLDAGQVVADLVYAVVLAGVLEKVLFPPP